MCSLLELLAEMSETVEEDSVAIEELDLFFLLSQFLFLFLFDDPLFSELLLDDLLPTTSFFLSFAPFYLLTFSRETKILDPVLRELLVQFQEVSLHSFIRTRVE